MSKRAIQLIQSLLVLTLFLLFIPKAASAASCTFVYYPSPPNQNMADLTVTVTSPGLKSGTYRFRLSEPMLNSNNNYYTYDVPNINFDAGEATFTVKRNFVRSWNPGQYKAEFIRDDLSTACSSIPAFTIPEIPASSCIAKIITKPIDPNIKPELKISDLAVGDYNVYINDKQVVSYNPQIGETTYLCSKNDPGQKCLFDIGTYTVRIRKSCGPLDGTDCDRLQCNPTCFTVAPLNSGGGGECTAGTIPTSKACDPTKDKNCASGGGKQVPGCNVPDPNNPQAYDPQHPGIATAIATAIGCIHTNPPELVKDFMTFVIGISGGLAFLMMLLGAFQMLTSSGNPETLHAGRERLTNAVIGLLIVIFAVLLLQIIGVGILNIPGFK